MKRQILKSLSALCVSAMALFAASSLVVSCYDDSKLWDEMDDVKGEISDVKAEIEALKTALANLTSKVDGLYTLTFQVTSDNELQYSFDGTTWKNTGVVIPSECTCEPAEPAEPAEPCDCVAVSLVDNGDSVTITVGDQSFTIEKPEIVKFEILSGKQFFDYGQTKEVVLSAKGIKSVFIAKTPNGWSVEADGTDALVVTAPAESDYSAAQKGAVEVWAASEEGAIMVGTLGVVVSDETCVITYAADSVTFLIANDPDYGNPYTVFYGVSTADEFEADAAEVVAAILNQSEAMYELNSNWNYEAEIKVPVEELIGSEPVTGSTYIFWAVTPTMVREGYSWVYEISVADFVKCFYTPTEVKFEYLASWKDVELAVEVLGADEYFAGWVAYDEYFDPEYFDIQEYLNSAGGWFGPAGMYCYYNEKWEGTLSNFCSPDYSNSITPNTSYFVFILPIDPLKPIEDYTNDDVFTQVVKTDALQPGGSATATLDLTAENAVKPTELRPVVKTTGAAFTYYEWFDAEKLALYSDDELLIDYILNESWYASMRDEAEFQAPYTSGEPETEYTLVLLLVDNNGKYSLQKEVIKTAALPLTDEVSVTFDEENCVVESYKATLKVVLDGEFEQVIFWKTEPTTYYQPTASDFETNVCSVASDYRYKYVNVSDLVDGTYTYDVEPETDYTVFVIGRTADGKYSYADSYSFKPVLELGTIKTEGFTVTPTVTYNLPTYTSDEYPEGYNYRFYAADYGTYYYYEGSYTVNPNGAGKVKAYVVDANDLSYGYDWNTLTPSDKVKKMLLDLWCTETEEEKTFDKNINETVVDPYTEGELPVADPVIVLVWQEADGTYCLLEQNISEYFKVMRADLHQKMAEALINGKQWEFIWADMGDVPTILDFGVTVPGQFGFAYDACAAYGEENLPVEMHGMYMWYMGWTYEIVATDATSGVINASQVDHFGDTQVTPVASYSNLTPSTVTFTSEMLELNNVEATLAPEKINVYVENMGGGVL